MPLRSCLILHRRQNQLDLSKIRNGVAQNEREIIFQVELNRWAQARALREEDKVLQLEDALDNLINGTRSLVDLHTAAVLTDNGLLLGEIAHAAEDEVRS